MELAGSLQFDRGKGRSEITTLDETASEAVYFEIEDISMSVTNNVLYFFFFLYLFETFILLGGL